MYFEGDAKKRTYTYNYLFCCVTSIEKLPKAINLPKKCVKDIFFVFKKKDRILKKLHYVNNYFVKSKTFFVLLFILAKY